MPGRRRVILLAAAAGGCAALAAFILPAESAMRAGATAGLKAVSYAGYHFEVPESWPVFGLSGKARTCVRFDRHAVYLGTPAVDELCPSKLIGTTEAIEIHRGPGTGHRETLEDAVARTITASAPGIVATATFDSDRAVITRILASAGLARPVVQTAALGTGDFAAAATPGLSAQVANEVGLGFDTCAAPSNSVMQAWRARSPYRAIGIYLGGADRACAQPNLTPAWVSRQARSGWHFIPMYAGPQPALGQVTAPARQGTATAMDAAAQARRLGFGPGTPLYYNTEAYPPRESVATLRFLSAWTTELHRLGYSSGVYSSSGSGIADLARQYRTGRYAIPDVIYDALRNGQANTVDSVIRPGEWPGGRRIHQFSGNVLQRFGGRSMLIDQDFLNVVLPVRSVSSASKSLPAAATGTTQSSAALMNSDGSATVFFAGPGHQLIQQSQSAAGHWTRTNLGGFLTSDPSAVQTGSHSIEVFYRGAGNRLWERTRIGTYWLTARQLPQLGPVGAPHAVSGLSGVVDVFWRGLGGVHLWHAQFDPETGWAGPQNLGGSLTRDDPYPVESPSGHVEVFWRGDNGSLWRVVRSTGTAWGRPQNLGTATLAVRPQAAALSNNEIDVLWRRTSAPRWIASLVLRPTSHVVTSVSTGALGTARPWVVVAAGKEWILYRAVHGGLRVVTREAGGRWSASSWVRGGTLASAPFAAAGPVLGPLVVFWTGPDHQLFAQRFTQASGWGRPADLGAVG